MDFYKRAATGRYSHDEQMLLQSIQKLIEEKQIPIEDIPECHSIDDLIEVKQLLENYGEAMPSGVVEDLTILESAVESVNEGESASVLNDEGITTGDWNEDSDAFIAADYDPFNEPIIERSYTQADTDATNLSDEGEEHLELEDTKSSPLADLPPHTKRKAAEQTADTLLKGYAQFAPMPFKWMAKLPESKIEKMAFNGELDLSIEVSEGLTFDDYMKQTNAQIDEIFEVDGDTLSDIREPLIEVLMEQDMVLTPAQRLTAAIISHLAQMFTVALKLRQQNNRILSYQKHLTFLAQGSRVA